MAMAAGLLGVRLDKRGAYELGAGLEPPNTEALARCRDLIKIAGFLSLAMIASWLVITEGQHVVAF